MVTAAYVSTNIVFVFHRVYVDFCIQILNLLNFKFIKQQ